MTRTKQNKKAGMSAPAGSDKPQSNQQGSGSAAAEDSKGGEAAPAPAAAPAIQEPVAPLPLGAYHTIALIQPSKHDSTRFYQDFPNMLDAVDGLLKMFETRLKEYNPGAATISYDYNSLCQYLDDMREVCLLSWEPTIQGYKRYDRSWVKGALQDHLSNQAVSNTRR